MHYVNDNDSCQWITAIDNTADTRIAIVLLWTDVFFILNTGHYPYYLNLSQGKEPAKKGINFRVAYQSGNICFIHAP